MEMFLCDFCGKTLMIRRVLMRSEKYEHFCCSCDSCDKGLLVKKKIIAHEESMQGRNKCGDCDNELFETKGSECRKNWKNREDRNKSEKMEKTEKMEKSVMLRTARKYVRRDGNAWLGYKDFRIRVRSVFDTG